jgi:antitoxin component of RelBE/YafQ-DinJ toxin-antitoxin module
MDEEEVCTAIRLLQQYVEVGNRLPLDYTLPSGRSIEALCDRVQSMEVPPEVEQRVRYLAGRLGVTLPDKINYAVVLREIARRLTMPFDQRQAPLIRRGQ